MSFHGWGGIWNQVSQILSKHSIHCTNPLSLGYWWGLQLSSKRTGKKMTFLLIKISILLATTLQHHWFRRMTYLFHLKPNHKTNPLYFKLQTTGWTVPQYKQPPQKYKNTISYISIKYSLLDISLSFILYWLNMQGGRRSKIVYRGSTPSLNASICNVLFRLSISVYIGHVRGDSKDKHTSSTPPSASPSTHSRDNF